MLKNVTGQKWLVYAYSTASGLAVTGDAANITANLYLDGTGPNAVDDTNPAELEDGYYIFDISQAESNADLILICPATTTANTRVVGVPASLWTIPANLSDILGDTNELQGDWTNGGRLDLLIDAIKVKTDLLPDGVAKNTALANFMFLMIDSADHVTPKTGLTVTAQRSIDGAAFAACAGAVTELSAGIYKISLANTDMNGDVICLKFTATGADARYITIKTQT